MGTRLWNTIQLVKWERKIKGHAKIIEWFHLCKLMYAKIFHGVRDEDHAGFGRRRKYILVEGLWEMQTGILGNGAGNVSWPSW